VRLKRDDMIGKRDLTISDYLMMLRRRVWVLIVPVLIAAPIAFLVSFGFPRRFTSQTLMLVQEQEVPEGFVKPIVSQQLTDRVTSIQAKVLTRNRLQPIIERYGLQRKTMLGEPSIDDVVSNIQQNVVATPLQTSLTSNQRTPPGKAEQITGFYIKYTDSSPAVAQKVCNELASMFVEEDLRMRQQSAQGTTAFMTSQVNVAKQTLDGLDTRLAAFKRHYFGQLPEDQQNNLKILSGLGSQLDATTQSLNRAEEDKAYTESMLAQSLATWKASQSNTDDPKALKQQLASLQSQLVGLQSKYTDQYPDVIKTKKDLAEVQRRLNETNSADSQVNSKKASTPAKEPPDIAKLRAQLQQDKETIEQTTSQQKRIQDRTNLYQSRLELTPEVEEEYKKLTRDYDTQQKFYSGLLSKKNESEMTSDMERRQEGEQIRVQEAATLPEEMIFPERAYFAGGGLGAGLVLGLAVAMMFELRDSSLRNELDVEACLDLPTLISIPWVGNGSEALTARNGNGNGGVRTRHDRESSRAEMGV
jgi:polysaccharide chain length determinant protein (PEP-CTERM system associated)